MNEGYQPTGQGIDINKIQPPQGGSGVPKKKIVIEIEEIGYEIAEEDVEEIVKDYKAFMTKWKKYFRCPEGITIRRN
jgi:hypothetical protein